MRKFGVLALSLAGLLAGCGGNSSGPDDGGRNGSGIPNFSASIEGVTWRPSIAVSAINAMAGLYSITANKLAGPDNYTMVFSLWNIRGPGTYPLGVGAQMQGGTAQLSRPPSSGWSTPLTGASGSITITTLTATRMVATFDFVADGAAGGGAGTRTVANGSFDIPVTGTGGVAAANQGHIVTGNIGGSFSAAAAAMVLTTGANPVLTIAANNSLRSITISIANMTAPGTYALSAATPTRTIGVSGTPGNQFATWASQVTGGSGTVTVASVTSTRLVGSFNAILAPLSGGATGNLTVSGNFDMGRQ